ncbi:hypothetical protein [Serratia marcescens]|uniref:hypothetical protein n=1 Tax=Serratia marcescens TaxID=615 RepID=UPI000E3DA553|nr:hypothetical protein [Serratia marcescens]RFT77753.1 hypothetical protein DX900_23450 [Serratia marcescens]TFZ81382.1 hypothetical protein E4655_22055 [Serratia marcescens]
MIQLTLGRHRFTLSDNDALFVAEAILLLCKHPDIVLPEHRSEKYGVIFLTNRQAELRRICADEVVDHYAID